MKRLSDGMEALAPERISSAQNPKIKKLLELQAKSKMRRETGLFVLEGRREIEHCIASGFRVDSLFVCREIFGTGSLPECSGGIFEVTPQIYDKLAYRGGTEGIIAEVESKAATLDSLEKTLYSSEKNGNGGSAKPLVVVLEAVEKPGNLGAVLRSADAAGADAVIVCDPLTDIYNPNLIRASIGAVFTVPVVACSSAEAMFFLKTRGFAILTAQLQDSDLYYDVDMTGPVAIVMGTESTGLTPLWREAASAHIRIPMLGRLDSLNVSVSAAILLFEAVRQRQNNRKEH